MTEKKKSQSDKMRRAVVMGHRKRKGLCLHCGLDPHPDSECSIERYEKADFRDVPIQKKEIDFDKKVKNVVSYRRKKELCPRCGDEGTSEICQKGDCDLDYSQSDNRTESQKKEDPRTILTPKKVISHKPPIQKKKDKFSRVKLQRDFYILDLAHSKKGFRIEFSFLNYLSKKYSDSIICVVGDLQKEFPFSQYSQIRKMTNISEVKFLSPEDKINYALSSLCYFGFENETSKIVKENAHPNVIFSDDCNVTHLMNRNVIV